MALLGLFDTETTSLDPSTEDICQFATIVQHSSSAEPLVFESLCNPGLPINPDATAVHGITDEMVADKPSAKSLVQEWFAEILELAKGELIILGGHNTEFDWEFIKKHIDIPSNVLPLCTMRLARRMAPTADNHKLEYLYRDYYKLSSSRTVTAHDALCDVWMCFELLQHWFPNLPDYEALARQLLSPIKLTVMPFGKHKGTLFTDLPWHYIQWLNKQDSSMDKDVKFTAELCAAGRY